MSHAEPNRSVSPSSRLLSPARQRLLSLLIQLHFGKIESLPIVEGEPQLKAPGCRIVQEIKFAAADDSVHFSGVSAAYLAKRQVVELLALLDQHPNTLLEVLDVKHGTPFRALMTQGRA
jgi:broad specificity phosphatase PhoE